MEERHGFLIRRGRIRARRIPLMSKRPAAICSSALRERLESAARLYRGDLLPGFYEEWVQAERQLLRQRYTSILSRLVTHLEKTREYPAAISYGERLLSCDPLSEAKYQTLIRLHALNGDRAGALRTYHQCVAVLRRELNVEPGISTRKLYEEMARLNPGPTETQTPPSRSAHFLLAPRGAAERTESNPRIVARCCLTVEPCLCSSWASRVSGRRV